MTLRGFDDVEIADERGVDPALIRAVRPQRVVLGEDQARADPVGRGRRGGRVSVSQRAADHDRGERGVGVGAVGVEELAGDDWSAGHARWLDVILVLN